MNDISTDLGAVRKRAEEAKDKREGNNGRKEEDGRTSPGGRNGEANELNGWIFWQLPPMPNKSKLQRKICKYLLSQA